MKSIAVSLAAALVLVVASNIAISGSEPELNPTTMISRLKVGQPVRLQTGRTGGFNVVRRTNGHRQSR